MRLSPWRGERRGGKGGGVDRGGGTVAWGRIVAHVLELYLTGT